MTAPASRPLALSPATLTTLDLTRGVAAQVVLLGHAFDFFNVFSFLGRPDPPPQIQRLAVVVFFLLSGFLIARSLHRHRLDPHSGFGNYLADRAARIYSGLIPALLCIALLDALPFDLFELDYFEGDAGWTAALANLLHLQHYPGTAFEVYGSGVPLWTLSIEWWLYVVSGALVLGVRRQSFSWLALALLPIAAISVGANLLGGEGHGIALTWGLGVAAYALSLRMPPGAGRPGPWLLGSAAALALALAYAGQLPPQHPAKAFDRGVAALLAVAFFLLVQGTQRLRDHRTTRQPSWLRAAADSSYTLYLTHFTVLTVLYQWRGDVDDRILLVVGLLVCNLVALALAPLGEHRRRRLRALLPPTQRSS